MGEDVSVPALVSWLPFTEDVEEAEYVYTYLCELINRFAPPDHACI